MPAGQRDGLSTALPRSEQQRLRAHTITVVILPTARATYVSPGPTIAAKTADSIPASREGSEREGGGQAASLRNGALKPKMRVLPPQHDGQNTQAFRNRALCTASCKIWRRLPPSTVERSRTPAIGPKRSWGERRSTSAPDPGGHSAPVPTLGHDPEKCEAVFRKDHAQARI